MPAWQRRAITWSIIAILLAYMYRRMAWAGFSVRAMLFWFGVFALLTGIAGIFIEPDKKFAQFMGTDVSKKTRLAINGITILIGITLLSLAAFGLGGPS